jgi:drug/metabolite transporter (DMT)-like permease
VGLSARRSEHCLPIARSIVLALVSLWAMLLFGEVLSGTVLLGIGLIVTGIALSNWKALRMGLGKAALGLGCIFASVYR